MSSQRPKKIKASRGGGRGITLPPELAAHYLRNVHANSGNTGNDDAEMKALMSMFVEIMGMSPDATTSGNSNESKGMSFSFSSGPSSSTTQWPPTAAAAAAAAASGMFSSDGQWSFDYYDEDEEEDDDDDDVEDQVDGTVLDLKQHAKASSSTPTDLTSNENTDDDDAERSAAEAMARQIAQDEQAAEEERAKKAAKKREKKLRKKEKAKQEAALKNKEAEQKKRSKQIQSWRSRVVAACQSNENYKIQGLLAESPLGKQPDEDVTCHLEFLLPHCIATSKRDEGDEACQKLATYVITMSVSVAFTIGRNGRSALHNACFVGDCFFVKVVTDKSQQDSPLDLLCKDSGWTPLHYAVAAGCPEAMEELLIVGCDFDTCTDESLTCRASNGEGITARELAEIISSGEQDDEIETQGNALEEAMQRYACNKGEKKTYLRTVKSMAERLKDCEENGYAPPMPTPSESSEADEEDVKQRSASVSEDGKKRNKKKKKKQPVKREQSDVSAVSSAPSVATSVSSAPVEKKEDPLVTALLGMGFTEDQIYAAAKACGGMDRATADEMVMWILGGGEESPSPQPASRAETSSPEAAFVPTSRSSAKPAKKSTQQQPAANVKRSQNKKQAEAIKREEEARAVADRLAAKREEQRRRNREWNNRAQARQKEEMELRAQEEARRIAKERAAAQRQAAVAAGKMGANSLHVRAGQAPAPTQILQRPTHMPVGGIPAGMVPAGMRPHEANMMGYSGQGYAEYDGMGQYVSSGNSVSSAGSSRNAVAAQYVSSGNSVSSAGSGMPAMAAQYVSSGNSVSSGGSGMYHQAHQPMYGYPAQSVPPPGFQSFGGAPPAVSTGSSNMSLSEETPVNYEESGSGEIRATARSFVPTGFKATPAPSDSAEVPTPAPPPVNVPSTTEQSQPVFSNEDPLASLLSATAPAAAPSSIGASPAVGSTAEEPSLDSVIGFNLNETSNGSSLLGSLSIPPADGAANDKAGASIWGGTSALAPGPSSFSGFGAPGIDAASKTGDTGVSSDGGSGLWNSGANPGTSRLGSIW